MLLVFHPIFYHHVLPPFSYGFPMVFHHFPPLNHHFPPCFTTIFLWFSTMKNHHFPPFFTTIFLWVFHHEKPPHQDLSGAPCRWHPHGLVGRHFHGAGEALLLRRVVPGTRAEVLVLSKQIWGDVVQSEMNGILNGI